MTVVVPKNPALNVLFFLTKHTLSNPSHSSQLICGLGFFGTSLTTLLSTAGGGRKLLRPIFIMWVTVAHICVLTERREYSAEPGRAKRRWANSSWKVRMQVRGEGDRVRSLNVRGEEIWEGILAQI
jgi:hypothetical protein